jgi:monoamine oxidase
MKVNRNKSNIIIIGAGVAGLTAAKLLHEDGFDVMILEAKNRVGGRTHTIDLGGTKADAGASWIHYKNGNPITYIAQEYGFEIIEDVLKSFQIWDSQKGQKMGLKRFLYLSQADKIKELGIEKFQDNPNIGQTAADFFNHYAEDKKWNPQKERILRFLYKTLLEVDYAARIEDISFCDEYFLNYFEEENQMDGFLLGGYSQLVNLLSEGLDIQLSTVVERIDYTDSVVSIFTNQGQFECEKIVVTVPLGVLKTNAIVFNPPLPERKQKAIQSIGYGNLEKVIFTFDKSFSLKEKVLFYIGENENGLEFPLIYNASEISDFPTLIIFYAANFAKEMQEKTATEIANAAQKVLEKTLDIPNLKPRNIHVTKWSKDPYFLGSYSYSKTDSTESEMNTLTEPLENKVYFSGEATSPEGQGYVHGALLSGVREAKRLGASLKGIKGLEKYFREV